MERTTPYRPPLNRRAATAPSSAASKVARCPYLGTSADPGTALAFPSDANHCFRTNLPVPISSIHQENYCLVTDYEQCPVYRQHLEFPEIVPLAAVAFSTTPITEPVADMRLAPAYDDQAVVTDVVVGRPPRLKLSSLVAGLLVLALLVAAWWAWRGFLSDPSDNTAGVSNEVSESGSASAPLATDLPPADEPPVVAGEAGDELAGSGAAVALPVTATAMPTPTAVEAIAAAAGTLAPAVLDPVATETAPALIAPTETVAAALSTLAPTGAPTSAPDAVACMVPDWWVPTIIRAGETLPGLAFARGVPLRQVLTANCLTSLVVSAGMTVWLPPVAIVGAPIGGGGGGANELLPPATALPIITPGPIGPTATIVPGPGQPGLRPTTGAPRPTRTPQPQLPTPTSVAPPTSTPPTLPTATPPVLPTVTKTPPGIGQTPAPPTSTPPTP